MGNKTIDTLDGIKFGKLTVIHSYVGEDSHTYVVARCFCNGNVKKYRLSDLRRKDRQIVSCGCFRKCGGLKTKKDEPLYNICKRHNIQKWVVQHRINTLKMSLMEALTTEPPKRRKNCNRDGFFNDENIGKTIGKLTFVKFFKIKNENGVTRYKCFAKCGCDGNVREYFFHNIINGTVRSCGCVGQNGECDKNYMEKLIEMRKSLVSKKSECKRQYVKKIKKEYKYRGNFIGKTFNSLTIKNVFRKNGVSFCEAECMCNGNVKQYMVNDVSRGKTKSCGCWKDKKIRSDFLNGK